MKKRAFFWILGILFFASGISAQGVPQGLVDAFKRGSSQALSVFLSNKVELVILNQTSTANKDTVEREMAAFFSRNSVNDFTVNHEGNRNESSFIIGTLNTSSGSYRVNCFFKKVQDKNLIHQIRIDKTNE